MLNFIKIGQTTANIS